MYSIHLYLFSPNFSYFIFQAPQPSSFDHFWHLVIQEKVEVILMVTELVEGGKPKADKFWPEEGEDDIKVVGDVNIKYKSSESKGNLTIREFTISQRDEAQRIVTLVQPELDLDLSKTGGSEQLVTIVQRTNVLWRNHKVPLMVMCEDGSGRTGAFIAIYKLWVDLQDPDCSSLALLPTGNKFNWEICSCCTRCPKKCKKK